MNNKDIRTDTYINSSPIKKMRLTYIPTGENVSGEGRSLYHLKEKLLAELSEVIVNRQLQDAETLRSHPTGFKSNKKTVGKANFKPGSWKISEANGGDNKQS